MTFLPKNRDCQHDTLQKGLSRVRKSVFGEKGWEGGAVFTKVIGMFGFQCLVNERDSHNET